MNKKLTFLLALTFLFLFSGSVYGDDLPDGIDAFDRGDYKEAIRLFRISAEQGNADGQVNLGTMYGKGLGVPQDYKEAFRLFRLSAEQGNDNGQYNLGVMYMNGREVPQNYKEAVKWYRLAAEQGFPEAQDNLGYMYYTGQGVPQDYLLAHMWVNLAASSGAKNIARKREIVERKMTKQQIEKAQELARNWKPKQKSKGLLGQFKEKVGIK
jgi:uncharacterized protein